MFWKEALIRLSTTDKQMIDHRACLQKNDDFPPARAKQWRKNCHFHNVRELVRALITCKFIRSRDVQCKTEEWFNTYLFLKVLHQCFLFAVTGIFVQPSSLTNIFSAFTSKIPYKECKIKNMHLNRYDKRINTCVTIMHMSGPDWHRKILFYFFFPVNR